MKTITDTNLLSLVQNAKAQIKDKNIDPSSLFANAIRELSGEGTTSTAEGTKRFNFADMTRDEIVAAGKELFKDGRITLDELFRFDHPDGKLRTDETGSMVELSSDDRIDFIAETRRAISGMEQTGDADRSDSSYDMLVGLLEKLDKL